MDLGEKLRLDRIKNTCFLMVVAGAASWACLGWIFPGFLDVYWPQHGDFYTPASIANLRPSLIHYRPVGIFLDILRGSLGVRPSIVIGHLVVLLNAALVGQLAIVLGGFGPAQLRRASGVCAFATYATLLFSHPYFFTFSLWDFYSQAALTFTLCAILVYLSPKKNISAYAIFAFLATLSFLTKETYGLSFLVLLALRREGSLKGRWPGRPALAYAALVTGCFAAALVLNRALNSPFVSGSAEVVAPYRLSLDPTSVFYQWAGYLRVGFGSTLALVILSSLGLAFFNKRCAYNGAVLLVAGLLAWLPNSLLPNHYFAGYSWNGATLLYAPVLQLGLELGRNLTGLARGGRIFAALTLAAVWGQIVFKSARIDHRSDNAWVLEQMDLQKYFFTDLMHLLRQNGRANPKRVLLSGVTFTFTPLEFPGSFLPERKAAGIQVTAVRYGHAHEASWRPGENLEYVAVQDARVEDYDEVWLVHQDGSIALKMGESPTFAGISESRMPLYPDLIGISDLSSSWRDQAMVLRRYREFRLAKGFLCREVSNQPGEAHAWFLLALTVTELGEDPGVAAANALKLANPAEALAWKKALKEAGWNDASPSRLDPCETNWPH